MSSATAQKRAAFSILRFLNESLQNGTIKADDAEGIEVASQCIAEAFGLDADSEQDKRAYGVEKSLEQLVQDAANQAAAAAPAASAHKGVSADDKQAAEAAKSRGNQLMAKKDYQGAVDAYSEAIEKDGSNPVYWSNRAAAYSQIGQHDNAVSDAREAINVDPSFSKAYSRLGHALFSIGQYADAVEAYEKGLELDPNNATMKSSLATARSRAPAASSAAAGDASGSVSPRAGAGAGAGTGAGGIPGFPGMGGGMPDLAGMMNNPAIMNMAQQMMQNGGLERMMQNPMIQQMMGGLGGGAGGAGGAGGMPDMAALMADPEMRRLAEQFGSAMGGPGGAGGSGNGNSNMYS
ncbi:hypothetical protein JCM3774_006727 [Rhodotorula dairenensis]